MSTYDSKGNRVPEWYELPPITEPQPVSMAAICHLLNELNISGPEISKTDNFTNGKKDIAAYT